MHASSSPLQSFLGELEDSPLDGFDIAHQISRLRQSHRMPAAEVETILRTFAIKVQSDEQIVAVSGDASSSILFSATDSVFIAPRRFCLTFLHIAEGSSLLPLECFTLSNQFETIP